jgi:signal recognition particle receptor subunit alpha
VLLEQSKTQKQAQAQTAGAAAVEEEKRATAAKPSAKGKKEMRHWHDGNAKVTDKTMAALDMSKGDDGTKEDAHARALVEARQAYLPTEQDLLEEEGPPEQSSANTWGSAFTGLLQQMTGNKILTSEDLDQPLQEMEKLLESKNVAASIAHELCESVRKQLVGKRLNSLYRVQTAVQQALEKTMAQLLRRNEVDLLRNVVTKRGSLSFRSKRPYVITVMGINGIGKTTSLAKLAYYFQQHGCKPMLVAGDTFRSGAVEQLRVHAECLEVPLFSQGYSKDPSAVAKAAIQKAAEAGNDVVLIDTAGRMQNNVPLMKALGKLVQENQPDFCILVCEALVGHDGLNQFKMFRQALGRRGIDGLILTKFDTVDKKVGASLTLTHETGSPIVFIGVGQKYHHLKKLDIPTVINSLFS